MRGSCLLLLFITTAAAATNNVSVARPAVPPVAIPPHGTAVNALTNESLGLNSLFTTRDDRAVFTRSGELHYARVPAEEWWDELEKMKAGGLDTVQSYVFWIHHEEVRGEWDWSGRRSLRNFTQTVKEVGLNMVLRAGPWSHGECRNGGFPDWLQALGDSGNITLRSNDPTYLGFVEELYSEIAQQVRGLTWGEGGPIVMLQVENEFNGPAEHLLTLKNMSRDSGMDVPFVCRTGWPAPSTPLAHGALVPLFGAYADTFWDRELTPAPDKSVFFFDILDTGDNNTNPRLSVEEGGGMETSYHRRVKMDSRDMAADALVSIGSGAASQGYYMYHGGENPDGRLSTLQESQVTNYPNDLPVKSYDFFAPLGEIGQLRDHFHRLRSLHLMLRDWGEWLAKMPATLPDLLPVDENDTDTTRWSVRSNGAGSGMIFVNNYERLNSNMTAKAGQQFAITFVDDGGGRRLLIPDTGPFTIPADSFFLWPFGMPLGGVTLRQATVQPLAMITTTDDDGSSPLTVAFFAVTEGISADFVIEAEGGAVTVEGGSCQQLVAQESGALVLRDVAAFAGRGALLATTASGRQKTTIVLLDAASGADRLWSGQLGDGQQRVVLGEHGTDMLMENATGHLRLLVSSNNTGPTTATRFSMFPPAANLTNVATGESIAGTEDGVFSRFEIAAPPPGPAAVNVSWSLTEPAGPAREIRMGSGGVAQAPNDTEFEQAAKFRLKLAFNEPPLPTGVALRLSVRYAGDCARMTLNVDGDKRLLLTDNFYNGEGILFEVGLNRFADDGIFQPGANLDLEILPLRPDAPIYLEDWPAGSDDAAVLRLDGIDVLQVTETVLRL